MLLLSQRFPDNILRQGQKRFLHEISCHAQKNQEIIYSLMFFLTMIDKPSNQSIKHELGINFGSDSV